MSVFNRLGFNFDTARFGSAHTLSTGAANTVNLISNNMPAMPDWQKTDLNNGGITRTGYFQNPTTTYVNSMLSSAAIISSNALTINAFSLSASANSLIIELGKFVSHTDNIAGVTTVYASDVPSYAGAASTGQSSLLTLNMAGEPQSNTDVMLGSFTSLFIQDILTANANQLLSYSIQLKNSISANTTDDGEGGPSVTTYSSNLANSIISSMSSYCNTTSSILNTRRMHDWNFHINLQQVTQDNGFLQQFNNLGATQKYLIKNVIGTTSLVDKLTSANTI
jgi:hypothetical protein